MNRIFLITFLAFLFGFQGFSQENVLVERSYWKAKPTLDQVKKDIAKGNDPAAFNEHTFDAVTWAILENASDEIVWYLINLPGNDVNKRSHDGRTPIFWAAYKNNVALMQALISKGAKTDLIDSHGYSLVNFAATTGQTNIEIYDLCLKHGAKFAEESNNDGANPILLLVPYLEDNTFIDYFGKNGVDFRATDKHGNNAFVYAAKTGNIKMMELALKAELDPRANNDAAMVFAGKGTRSKRVSLAGFKYLMELGLSTFAKDEKGNTALHYLAAKSENTEILDFFLSSGVDANYPNNDGETPFLNAVSKNSVQIVKFFLDKTKNVNVVNEKGENAMHLAAARGDMDVIEALHNAGVSVNVQSNEQLSPLHLAAMKAEDASVLQLLLKLEADKSLITEFEETAYDLALENEKLQAANVNLDFLRP